MSSSSELLVLLENIEQQVKAMRLSVEKKFLSIEYDIEALRKQINSPPEGIKRRKFK